MHFSEIFSEIYYLLFLLSLKGIHPWSISFLDCSRLSQEILLADFWSTAWVIGRKSTFPDVMNLEDISKNLMLLCESNSSSSLELMLIWFPTYPKKRWLGFLWSSMSVSGREVKARVAWLSLGIPSLCIHIGFFYVLDEAYNKLENASYTSNREAIQYVLLNLFYVKDYELSLEVHFLLQLILPSIRQKINQLVVIPNWWPVWVLFHVFSSSFTCLSTEIKIKREGKMSETYQGETKTKRYVMVVLFYSLLNVLFFVFLITICFCSIVLLMIYSR